MTFVQLVRPGAPVVFGSFASARCRCSRARRRSARRSRRWCSTSMAALARRLGVPFRSGGSLCASKIPDAQAAYESAATLQPTILGRGQLRAPRRRLAGGRPGRRLREVHPRRRPVRDDGTSSSRASTCRANGQALDAILDERARAALPRHRPHAGQLRDRLLPLGRRRQQQLRAVAGGRLARRRPAGQRHLEADAGRVRGAADRPGGRRGAARRSSPGARRRCPTRRSDGAVLFAPPRPARRRPARAALARRPRRPDLRAAPAQEPARPGRLPAAGRRASR